MRIFGISILSLLLLIGCAKNRDFGRVTGLTGTAQEYSIVTNSWAPLGIGATVYTSDSISTAKKSKAVITFGRGTITLNENTCITVKDTTSKGKRLIAVLDVRGEVLSNVKGVEQRGILYEVWTPTSVVHAEGTEFTVVFSPQPYTTNVKVLDGRVYVINPFMPPTPPVYVSPGYYTIVSYNAVPIAVKPINYGQFKKMQQVIGDDYPVYERKFKIQPVMDMDDPIEVSVPVMVSPPSPPDVQIVVTPFLLPPGPGMPVLRDRSFPYIPHHERVVVSGPVVPLPPMLPPPPRGRIMVSGPAVSLPPVPPMLPPLPRGRIVAPGLPLPPPPMMAPPTGGVVIYDHSHVVVQEHGQKHEKERRGDRDEHREKGHKHNDDRDRD